MRCSDYSSLPSHEDFVLQSLLVLDFVWERDIKGYTINTEDVTKELECALVLVRSKSLLFQNLRMSSQILTEPGIP